MSQEQKVIIEYSSIARSKTSIFIMLLGAISLIGSQILISGPLNMAYGETGIGKDVFKVVVSILESPRTWRYLSGCNGKWKFKD